MTLKLTLKPYERFIVNGCAMRNSGRRHTIVVEEKADVIRGKDLLEEDAAVTPVNKVYFLIQTALIRADLREKLVKPIQHSLAELATVFGPPQVSRIFEAANFVSQADYYKALRALSALRDYEHELLNYIAPAPELAPDLAASQRPDGRPVAAEVTHDDLARLEAARG